MTDTRAPRKRTHSDHDNHRARKEERRERKQAKSARAAERRAAERAEAQAERQRVLEEARAKRERKRQAVVEQLEEAGVDMPVYADGESAFGAPEVKIDIKAELERLKALRRATFVRRCYTLVSVVISALLQAYAIQAFVNPANLLSSGFTGLAILIERITGLFGVHFSTSLGMIALNIPVAIICWRSISRRFVVFSMLQVFLSSTFLRVLHFDPILDNLMLQVIFGGFLYGFAIAVALRAGASTAGTDFISLMVSNKTGKSIWGLVFAGNCCVLCVFGALFGWEAAAYSIIFQFISTKAIEMFHHYYERVTLQIITQRPDQILASYNVVHKHGSSVMEVVGGRSHQRYWLINTVASSFELDDIMQLIRTQDGNAVVNVMRTENFFGNFYRPPID